MKSFWKPFALIALTAFAVPGLANAASASEGSFIRFEATASAWICSCCPATCGGNILSGCFNNTSMPPNAVTCTYHPPGVPSNDHDPACVSCMASATPTTSEKEAFLQGLSTP